MPGSLVAKSTWPEVFLTDLLNKPNLFSKELVYLKIYFNNFTYKNLSFAQHFSSKIYPVGVRNMGGGEQGKEKICSDISHIKGLPFSPSSV